MQPIRLRAVLPVLFLLAGCPAEGDDTPTEGELRVLTYNVAGLPDGLSSADAPLLERMPQIASYLVGYDVVGLQEDFTDSGHAAVIDGAVQPTVEWFDEPFEKSRAYGSGLTLMANPEVVGYQTEHYLECNGFLDGASDCLASKGFQVLTLSLGGAEVDIYNTHHEAGGGDEDIFARSTQVDQVIASADGRSAGRAIVYMGDFNLRLGDEEDVDPLARYDAAGLLRSCDLLDCAEPLHIDQVRLRSSADIELEALEWRRVEELIDEDGVDLSDHPAIEVTVRWRRL